MKKLFITLLCAVFVVAASAQTRYLRINQLDGTVTKFAISTIDSIDFVIDNSRLENGYQAIDLGLPSGTLWATCNVGATAPEEYGDYFAWGETTTKSSYSWSTYKYGTSLSNLTKYNSDESCGIVDNKTALDLEDDAAAVNWGGDWCMPTLDEIKELNNNCTTVWTTDYNSTGVAGRIVISKLNGNSIFLPAAGYRSSLSLYDDGSDGDYWSSSLNTKGPGYAHSLCFDSDYYEWSNGLIRYYGRSVRAVCSSKK